MVREGYGHCLRAHNILVMRPRDPAHENATSCYRLRPSAGSLTLSVQAWEGTLDTDSAPRAGVSTDVGFGTYDEVRAVAVEPDGKLVVAGTSGYTGTQDFGIVRCSSDGTIDSTFGTAGRTIVPIAGDDDIAITLTL